MIVFPNAKINIGLNVVSRREDGYHDLETVFYPLPYTDALEMAETGVTGLTVSGIRIDADPDDNLVLKAYNLLKKDFDLPPVQFHLHKVIPPGRGLGGGSSDAAYTLRMLNDYFSLGLPHDLLSGYAALTGADCPYFIQNKPVFAEGKGDKLTPLNIDISKYHIIVLDPGCFVSTRQAYENVVPVKPRFCLKELPGIPVDQWKDLIVNDFETTVFEKFPVIKDYKEMLYGLGAVYASMSGSGSSVYGIFGQLPQNLKKIIQKSILFAV
jgi:4-diphosphocytidyl-2-C-methyl-D-erythritol kinase